MGAPHDHEPPVVLAPGYSPLAFVPPKTGSYSLPSMGLAADGEVLDSDGKRLRLHDVIGDKPTVLSFIFTSCDDVNGCPLATYVMRSVHDALESDSGTAGKARLVSLALIRYSIRRKSLPPMAHNFGPKMPTGSF